MTQIRLAITVAATLAIGALIAASPQPSVSDRGFSETFDGTPGTPTPWSPKNWDVIVHDRTDGATNAMHAEHDAMCGAPPGTHPIMSPSDAVFLCRDHMMTAVHSSDPGYAVAYLTPAAMADWSASAATISFDVSTFRSTNRDWIDLWLTPWDQNMVLPLEPWQSDLNGAPGKALHFQLINNFAWQIHQWPGEIKLSKNDWRDLPVPFSKVQRDTITVTIGSGRIKLSYRNTGDGRALEFENIALPANLGFDRAVVQFGHHSYTPSKDCPGSQIGSCGPNTWHWDNVKISPARPFTMTKLGQVTGTTELVVGPGWLRFAARGATELNWGDRWVPVKPVNGPPQNEGHFASYWMPIPNGATRVQIRGAKSWAGEWLAKSIAVWNTRDPASP